MSEGHGPPGHGEHQEVPEGAALQHVPALMVGLLVIVFLIIALQGAFVEAASPYFHVWPAADAAKVVLPPWNH